MIRSVPVSSKIIFLRGGGGCRGQDLRKSRGGGGQNLRKLESAIQGVALQSTGSISLEMSTNKDR